MASQFITRPIQQTATPAQYSTSVSFGLQRPNKLATIKVSNTKLVHQMKWNHKSHIQWQWPYTYNFKDTRVCTIMLWLTIFINTNTNPSLPKIQKHIKIIEKQQKIKVDACFASMNGIYLITQGTQWLLFSIFMYSLTVLTQPRAQIS